MEITGAFIGIDNKTNIIKYEMRQPHRPEDYMGTTNMHSCANQIEYLKINWNGDNFGVYIYIMQYVYYLHFISF